MPGCNTKGSACSGSLTRACMAGGDCCARQQVSASSLQKRLCTGVVLLATLLLASCGGGEETATTTQGIDPLVADFGIAYVRRPVPDEVDLVSAQELSGFAPGADLYFRDLASPRSPERNITFAQTGGLGDVKDVEVSYDGGRLLFAMRMPEIEGAAPDEQPTWNIWEYEIASGELQRVIQSDNVAEDGQDVAPHYLPDGRIIFSSSRQRSAKATLLDDGKPQFAALDENRNEHAMVLHVMRADGTDIHQVSFNQSHDLDPTVLESGEVVFTRWDNMGSRNALNLYRMNPDGTDLQLLYGANSHETGSDGATVQFLQPREMPDGSLVVVMRPSEGTRLGGDIVTIDIAQYVDNEQPNQANAGVLAGPAQESIAPGEVRSDALPSPGGRFNAVYPLWDGTERAFVSWSPCRLLEAGVIVPCSPARLADPGLQEAPPLYGIFLYDMELNTQLPVFTPQEGVIFSDVVAAQPRRLPNIIFDQIPGVELDQALADENAGVLDIRSVYDFDGAYHAFGGAVADIATLADPQQTLAADRPARFLRIVKAVGIPDRDTRRVPGSAYGRSAGQLMRELIGYAPIEPDGSVKVKVPAGVALAISVLDADGRRISDRHQNWLQVRPGETVRCNGCHDARSGLSHGRADAFAPLYAGAAFDGYQFPNTENTFFANAGETMAQARTRIDATALAPKLDPVYEDVWTDEVAAGRPKDTGFTYRYADLATPAPATPDCQTTWTSACRVVINYEQHIHPLWGRDRGANTCTACHTTDNMGVDRVADAQLDLGDGYSDQNAAQFTSYRELLFSDLLEALDMGTLQPVQATDGNGNLLFELDVDGNLLLDAGGNPVPIYATVAPVMSVSGARASSRFFSVFATGASHAGRLDEAELRLIAEWLDIGAQYFNNPFDVPQ